MSHEEFGKALECFLEMIKRPEKRSSIVLLYCIVIRPEPKTSHVLNSIVG